MQLQVMNFCAAGRRLMELGLDAAKANVFHEAGYPQDGNIIGVIRMAKLSLTWLYADFNELNPPYLTTSLVTDCLSASDLER